MTYISLELFYFTKISKIVKEETTVTWSRPWPRHDSRRNPWSRPWHDPWSRRCVPFFTSFPWWCSHHRGKAITAVIHGWTRGIDLPRPSQPLLRPWWASVRRSRPLSRPWSLPWVLNLFSFQNLNLQMRYMCYTYSISSYMICTIILSRKKMRRDESDVFYKKFLKEIMILQRKI